LSTNFLATAIIDVKKRSSTMALIRGFSKVEEEGRIAIPSNICRAAKLEKGQLLEIKVQGPNNGPYLVVNKRKAAR